MRILVGPKSRIAPQDTGRSRHVFFRGVLLTLILLMSMLPLQRAYAEDSDATPDEETQAYAEGGDANPDEETQAYAEGSDADPDEVTAEVSSTETQAPNSEAETSLMAVDTLTINLNATPLTTTNLQTVLLGLYSASDIATATTLKITGSGTLTLGNYSAATTSITYLNGLKIDTIDLSSFTGTLDAGVFSRANKIRTVALGTSITSLPTAAFYNCSSLTSVADTLAHARGESSGVVDLERTGVAALDVNGTQFYGCSSLTTVTLGDSITSLPVSVFNRCTNLTTVSNNLANAKGASANVIDLEKTRVATLTAGGNQFTRCYAVSAITLGTRITSLPQYVFNNCTALTTISDTVSNAQGPSAHSIDLGRTGISSFANGGHQFNRCRSIETVALGTSAPSLPTAIFSGCVSLTTVSDTLEHAQGVSEGLVDLDRIPPLTPGGYQFYGNKNAVIYKGADAQNLIRYAYADVASVFVPEDVSTLTVNAHAFEGASTTTKLFLRGPSATSPTTVINPENIPLATAVFYYEVGASTDGNGSITRSSGGFLPTAIQEREALLEGNLANGDSFVEPSQPLTYAITPHTNYEVSKIEATVGGATTDITASCTDNGDGTWTIPGVTQDAELYVTFASLPIVIYDDANSTGNAYQDPTTYVRGGPATVLGYANPAFASFAPPSGAAFSHWNTAADDSGTIYHAGDTFTITGLTTLYAVYGLYEVEGSSSGCLGVHMGLQDALDQCVAAGAGEAYTITVLGDDDSLSVAGITVPAGYTITLTSDENGPHVITQKAASRHVAVHGNLTIENVVLSGAGHTSGADFNGGIHVDGGTLIMNAGSAIQNCYNEYGGGVNVASGTFTMNDGVVRDNIATNNGGGVYVGGSFSMLGGSVTANTALKDGGGIFSSDFDYSDPANPAKYSDISIRAAAMVYANMSQKTNVPPSNAGQFTRFDGNLLDNDNLNYYPSNTAAGADAKESQSPSTLARTADSVSMVSLVAVLIFSLMPLLLAVAYRQKNS